MIRTFIINQSQLCEAVDCGSDDILVIFQINQSRGEQRKPKVKQQGHRYKGVSEIKFFNFVL